MWHMEKREQEPVTQEWWTHTKRCVIKYAMGQNDEFYQDMQQIFYFEGGK